MAQHVGVTTASNGAGLYKRQNGHVLLKLVRVPYIRERGQQSILTLSCFLLKQRTRQNVIYSILLWLGYSAIILLLLPYEFVCFQLNDEVLNLEYVQGVHNGISSEKLIMVNIFTRNNVQFDTGSMHVTLNELAGHSRYTNKSCMTLPSYLLTIWTHSSSLVVI